ncbi:tannase/feruloyl esterase family alpha/beta hydrolase [Marinomonas epiphytica]
MAFVVYLRFSVLVLLCLVPYSQAARLTCQSMVDHAPQGVQLTASKYLPNDDVTSRYCLLRGKVPSRLGSDGYTYQLEFELRLPDSWQGRFAYQFNDGHGGIVEPALGQLTGLRATEFAVNQGFAVLSSNDGHNARQQTLAGVVKSTLFAHDPQARINYGYQTVAQLFPIATQLTETYYQQAIQYTYGMGQGNGGRMAIVAASRFPEMFDGLIAEAPGINMPKSALQFPWDTQILHRLNTDIRLSLSKRELNLFVQSLLQQCDALDGINDDLILAYRQCAEHFEATAVTCTNRFDRHCLSAQTTGALITMHKGPHNSNNKALYSDWLFDTGIRSQNWRDWKVQSRIASWDYQPYNSVMGASALANIFMTPPVDVIGTPYSLETFLLNFDFDRDAPNINTTHKQFTQSAMDFMSGSEVNPKLEHFHRNGGKIMVFHGNSDPLFSAKDTMRWFDFLNFHHHGKVNDFVRLFLVPGMPHGEGGSSTDRFDILKATVAWVEAKQAPSKIIAYTRTENPEITPRLAGVSRPLCAYPKQAFYKAGPFRQASSFACR